MNRHLHHSLLTVFQCALALVLAAPPLPAADATASPLAGTWQLVKEDSTDPSPWSACTLTISVVDEKVTIARHLGAGRRTHDETFTFTTNGSENVVPSNYWADNRHIGAYMGDAHTRNIRAGWLDDGRILRVNSDFVLSTQQGERAVNVLSNYQVSRNGSRLTLIELRSTRTRPVISVFTRSTP